jgi:hypothetical protein
MDAAEHYVWGIQSDPGTIYSEWSYYQDDWMGVMKGEGDRMKLSVTMLREYVPHQQ